MATVYLVRDLKHGRPVALKVLHPALASTLGPERFQREILLAAKLQHPHILTVLDSGDAAGQLWYTMPYVEGETLRARLRREGRLPIHEAVRITREAAAALDYAHRHGVIHRDVKPENILLTADGDALVADFGIARALDTPDEQLTASGLVLGTPTYMSPEQASGDPAIDARTDVYSLACVLYEMLTGLPPFTGPTPLAALAKRLAEPAPPVLQERADVPHSLAAALARALARDPAERPPTAAAFAQGLTTPLPAAPASALPPDDRSVAVLPLADLSPDHDNEHFSDGMTDELINALAQVAGLRVASRTSVFALKGKEADIRRLGAQLNVSSVLEGSVRKAGSRLRVTIQLVHVADGYQLWSASYQRQLTDVFAIQDEIARSVVSALRVRLAPGAETTLVRPATPSLEAYNLYLKGRYFWNRRTPEYIRRAIDCFRQAIGLDPAYARAFAGLADAYTSLGLTLESGAIDPRPMHAAASAAAERALALAPDLAEAHAARAWPMLAFDWQAAEADAELRQALALSAGYAHAHHWRSHCLISLGRAEESFAESRRAIELEPLDLVMSIHLGWHHYFAHEPDRAIGQLSSALEMAPDSTSALHYLGLAYEHAGHPDEALAMLERAARLAPDSPALEAEVAHALARCGRRAETRAALDRLLARAAKGYVSAFYVARIFEGLGDHDSAFLWLERAVDERCDLLSSWRLEPRLDPLRADPRFERLVAAMSRASPTMRA